MRTDGGGILRYSYCDPAFIMGTPMTAARPLEDWAAISAQNRWQGLIFAGEHDARIVPGVIGFGRDVERDDSLGASLDEHLHESTTDETHTTGDDASLRDRRVRLRCHGREASSAAVGRVRLLRYRYYKIYDPSSIERAIERSRLRHSLTVIHHAPRLRAFRPQTRLELQREDAP